MPSNPASPPSTPPSKTSSCIMPSPSPFCASATKPRSAPPQYRGVKPLAFELEEQVRIYLEEALYPQALQLLLKFLLSGLASPLSKSTPAYIPPPSHLALIATLAIHPNFTTRTHNADKLETSLLALQYLSLLTTTVGPRSSGLGKAYAFPSTGEVSRRGTAPRRRDESPSKPGSGAEEEIASDLAGPGSVWVGAGDFWNVVGWAFNCSVAHKRRWERWRLWLEHVIEVLERDWEARGSGQDAEEARKSLIQVYAKQGDLRRILRAVFANGRDGGAEFKEVWKGETRERRKKEGGAVREKVKVDVENGEFGDYFNDSEDEEDDEDEVPEHEKANVKDEADDTIMLDAPSATELPSGSLPLGGPEALALRMRLISLMINIAWSPDGPDPIFPLFSVFHELSTHVRTFPLLTFVSIVSPPSLKALGLAMSSTFVQFISRSYLEGAAPVAAEYDLNQDILIKHLLPFAANTQQVAENAKLAACIETLIRLYDFEGGLYWSEKLETAVEKGIKKREDKAKKIGRKKGEAGSGSGEIDLAWLKGSGARMRLLIAMVKERK